MIKTRANSKNKKKKTFSQDKNFKGFPSYKANLDLMKLLATDQNFKRIVEDVRLFLEIPKDGLKEEKNIEEWNRQMDKRADDKILSNSFREQLKNISAKLKSGEIDLRTANRQSKLLHKSITWNYLKENVDFIIRKFSLPVNFTYHIREYILFNEVSAPPINYDIHMEITEDIKFVSNLPYMTVRIYQKLTDKELQLIKKETESNLGKNLKKYKEIKDIDQKIELDEWNRHKQKFDCVSAKSYKIDAKEIAQNVLHNPKKRQRVYDSTRRLQKLRKNRFGT
jgi:hypothetical protein